MGHTKMKVCVISQDKGSIIMETRPEILRMDQSFLKSQVRQIQALVPFESCQPKWVGLSYCKWILEKLDKPISTRAKCSFGIGGKGCQNCPITSRWK